MVTAQVPDFFLASTASILATLGVRTLFFAADELESWCELLLYMVAAVQALLGAKLLLEHWLQVPVAALLAAFIVVVALCSIGSFLQFRQQQQQQPAAARKLQQGLPEDETRQGRCCQSKVGRKCHHGNPSAYALEDWLLAESAMTSLARHCVGMSAACFPCLSMQA
eukprot:CAMPEP_0172783322 /NCGR_PEP_ID=MMETSP1074-20121228/204377_1 /TAXON_ID=2916 /ORGANISM="Ceratium fusus, Strain PA161109" /LENGTH=166 /DNA_ID=CAMNT_0013620311 /DNA_START=805 /DNA_END=1305 /DNA_ORIENTATION=-